MSRRLFDLSLVLSALPLALPLLLVAGLAIWLDTGRPIVYRSVRVGRSGRSFGMLRFRTVDLAVAAELPLEQRLSRAGRWIRDVSLDDLPNLFNVLAGDMSLVGPRPTEPERVDLEDPTWQRVLSVRPGMVSYAILRLGREYNASPADLKLQLEQDYVDRQSVAYDLRLVRVALGALVRSRGNVKARGLPSKSEY